MATLDKLLGQSPIGRANLNYFSGRFFELRGKRELAEKYYRLDAEARYRNRLNWTLSSVRFAK